MTNSVSEKQQVQIYHSMDSYYHSLGKGCVKVLLKCILQGKGAKFWKYLKSDNSFHAQCVNGFHNCDTRQNEIWQDIIKLHYLVRYDTMSWDVIVS